MDLSARPIMTDSAGSRLPRLLPRYADRAGVAREASECGSGVGEGEGGDRGRLKPLPDLPSYRAAGDRRPVLAWGEGERTLRQVSAGTLGGTAAWGEWGGGESNYMRGTMGMQSHVPIL